MSESIGDELTAVPDSPGLEGPAIGLAGADGAFQLLKKISQDRNVKLREIAHAINTGRELP